MLNAYEIFLYGQFSFKFKKKLGNFDQNKKKKLYDFN